MLRAHERHGTRAFSAARDQHSCNCWPDNSNNYARLKRYPDITPPRLHRMLQPYENGV